MNKKSLITILVGSAVVLASCNSGDIRRNPGKIYGPDMTYSRAYDAYTANPNFEDSLTSRVPVKGTIARGHALPSHLSVNDTAAYTSLQSPYKFDDVELEEGKRLYNIHCGICHGDKLDGNGPLYKDGSGPFAAAPANLKSGEAYLHMPMGKMYHAVVYGKNVMGSYASQLNEHQRWAVIAYIKKVQAENGGDAYTLAKGGTEPTTAKIVETTEVAKTTVEESKKEATK